MFAAIVCSVLLTADPRVGEGPAAEDSRDYQAAAAKVGRGAEAHVALALWCEAWGMKDERAKHLAIALLADPSNVTARGLMGQVDDGGKWRRPEDVAGRARADEAREAAFARYTALRDKAAPTADAQWKLSAFCDEHGLKPQAEAHARAVVRLDPRHKAAWTRLGCKNVGGRWMSEAQIAAEHREAEAQKQADRTWKIKLTHLKADLRDRTKRAAAEAELARVTDPRAVPSIVRHFSTADVADQAMMVQLLGQIQGGPASRQLAAAALYGDSAEVRRTAAETLIRRDPRDFVAIVIDQLRITQKYEVKPVGGPGSPGVLMVEGKDAILRRRYAPPSLPAATHRLIAEREAGVVSGIRGASFTSAVIHPSALPGLNPASPIGQAILRREQEIAADISEARKAAISSQAQLERDIAQIDRENKIAGVVNERALGVLTTSAGGDIGPDRDAWAKWWTDLQGYAFVAPPASRQPKPIFDQQVPPAYTPSYAVRHSCFATGTPVRTERGPKPIESLQVGDMVLSQDVGNGRLGFEPVVAVFHNPPAATFKVDTGDQVILATGIHRFWRAGKGWTMARDLKPGDLIRTLGGTSPVKSIEPEPVQPVYNLEVAHGRSFFVGKVGALVHDNSLVDATPERFDAP